MLNSEIIPGYFPAVQVWHLLAKQEKAIWITGGNYIKQSFRNRTLIATANGVEALVVPVQHPVWNVPYSQIKISYHDDWRKRHMRALESAYRKSPFFEWAFAELKAFYELKPEYLLEHNLASMQLLKSWFGLTYLEETNIHQTHTPKINWDEASDKPYPQVFADKNGFLAGMSGLDLFFNCGRSEL